MSHYFPTVNPGLKANHGKGRPKGSLNKTHATIRWSLIEAFRLNGGVDALAKWGKANPDLFYPMLTKLLPTELAEAGYSGDNRIQVVILPPEHSQSQVAPVVQQDTAIISTTNHLQQDEAGGLHRQEGVGFREPEA